MSKRLGVFVQEQWQVTERWNWLAGVRLDHYDDDNDDLINDSHEDDNDHGWSYRLGTTYRLTEQLHPYITWATGFVPQDADDQRRQAGGPFDPEESELYEAGIRSHWLDDALNVNVAVYHITKENILQSDINDDERMVALGEVRSQGVEVDVLGDLSERWVVNFSYAYNDTQITDMTSGINGAAGKHFANTPHHQAGLWTRYALPQWHSAVAFGANYVGEQMSRDGQTIRDYTIFDASWQTTWQDWEVQVNIKNLFNKQYAESGFIKRDGAFPGEHRRVYLTLNYHF